MSITPMATWLFIAECNIMPSADNAPCLSARMARGNRLFSSCSQAYCRCSVARSEERRVGKDGWPRDWSSDVCSSDLKFHFPQPVRSGLRVITLKDVDHAYGDVVVYRGMQYHAERGQRTVLVGPNGAGKSTFLKLLAGVLPVQRGEIGRASCRERRVAT